MYCTCIARCPGWCVPEAGSPVLLRARAQRDEPSAAFIHLPILRQISSFSWCAIHILLRRVSTEVSSSAVRLNSALGGLSSLKYLGLDHNNNNAKAYPLVYNMAFVPGNLAGVIYWSRKRIVSLYEVDCGCDWRNHPRTHTRHKILLDLERVGPMAAERGWWSSTWSTSKTTFLWRLILLQWLWGFKCDMLSGLIGH